MSQENVEVVKRVQDAINQRDVETLREILHPHGEFRSALARAEGGVYRGVEGMRQYFGDVVAVWEDFRIELEDVREAGDQLVVVWRATGTSRAGVPLDQVIAQVWTWREGRLWRNESFTDVGEALEAAGLRE